jgi:stage V sporulation protein R
MRNTSLPPELEAAREEIEAYAVAYGLDFYPIIYEVLDYRTLYETAALGGFPLRYPHWRFGMQYDQLMKGHIWMGSTIYEMVINTNPSYSYLLEGNEMVTQKMVMAHVTAHVDFFKNNMWFAHTNRKMLDEMANHSARIQRIIERQGYDIVEDFIDTCLSLENLIDYHAPYIKRPEAQTAQPIVEEDEETVEEGLKVDREYMREYINPPEFLEEQRNRLEQEKQRQKRFPENPQKDILLFLLNYAPLERWQHTILEIIRDEAYYFGPQGMTKIMNEGWACLVAGSLLYTDRGLLPIEQIVQEQMALQVSDGETLRQVYDWMEFPKRETIRLRTRRGLQIEGSVTHRVMTTDGTWRRLDELDIGDSVQLTPGPGIWSQEYISIDWIPRQSLQPVAEHARALTTRSRGSHEQQQVWHEHEQQLHSLEVGAEVGKQVQEEDSVLLLPPRHQDDDICMPHLVDETLATFLGYLVCNGTFEEASHTFTFTTPESELADHFVALGEELFALQMQKQKNEDEEVWHAYGSSQDVEALCFHLGVSTNPSPVASKVPHVILRSPESVVVAFLQAVYDAAGFLGDAGILLPLPGKALSQTLQIMLLNFGILSSCRSHASGCWRLRITGRSALLFQQKIGFGLGHKQEDLDAYCCKRQLFQREEWADEVVALEYRHAPVYDISVETTHCYAAHGFLNHNSYWHSQIMTQKALRPSEIISFADLHSGVVATSSGQLNPYKLGLELLRDIEDRWNKGKFGKEYEECDNIVEKRQWDKQLGLGRQKLFEIRRLYNDVTFIDEFLTPEFVLENKLFTFRYNRDTDLYEIASREFREIKEKLLFRLTNFGQPFISIEDANYNNRGELYLKHRHEGVDLQMDYARDTMRNLYKIWTRPIYLETIIEDRKRLISFDGRNLGERRME